VIGRGTKWSRRGERYDEMIAYHWQQQQPATKHRPGRPSGESKEASRNELLANDLAWRVGGGVGVYIDGKQAQGAA